MTAPTFPGSCTPCSSTMRSEAVITSRAGTSTKGKTPTGPVGVVRLERRRTSPGSSNSRRGGSLDSRIRASPSARKRRSASRCFLRLSLAARLRENAGVSGIRRLPGLRFGCLLYVADGDAAFLARAFHGGDVHAELFRLAFGGLGGVYFAFFFGNLLHVLYQDATLGTGALDRLDVHVEFLGPALGSVRSLHLGCPLNVLYEDTSLRARTFDGGQVHAQFLCLALRRIRGLHLGGLFRLRSGFLRLGLGLRFLRLPFRLGLLGRPPLDLDAPLDGLAVQGVLDLRGHRSKSLRIGDCQIREDLAVEVYLGQPQPVHEPGVGETVLASPGVYALDPERPEVTLALLAPFVGVDAALPDLFLGLLVRAALLTPVALRLLEHLAAPLASVDAACRTCQLPHPHEALDPLLIGGVDDGLSVEPPLAPGALLLQEVVVAGPAPPWWVFIFGIRLPPRFGVTLQTKELAAREKSRFAPDQRGALYQTVALAAGGPLLALTRLGSLRLFVLFLRSEDHDHVASVEVGLALDAPQVFEVVGDSPEEPLAELRMLHLAAPEHDRDLHLVATAQKAFDVSSLGVEVVVAYLGPELYLPHVDVDLLLAGGLAGLLLLVFVLAIVHQADHRRIRVRGDLDEVQVHPFGVVHRLADVLYPQLLTVGRDQPHRARPDLAIDPRLFFSRYCAPLLSKTNFGAVCPPDDDPR